MDRNSIPVVTRSQMAEIDNLMINAYRINLYQMMENAGRNLAELCRRKLGEGFRNAKILVLCGGGNNGGGGMVAARHLFNWGSNVAVTLSTPAEKIKDVPHHQLKILREMNVSIIDSVPNEQYTLLVDALIGYGLQGAPKGNIVNWIRWINEQDAMCISLDIPSGLDADSGTAPGDCVLADATLTLALPKVGMSKDTAKRFVGDLYLADISVPRGLLLRFFDDIPDLFSQDIIAKL